MRRLNRLSDDGGAVVVVVAILLAAGVLLAFGALTVDVGDVYNEREQLGSGADAAAWSAATACIAKGTCVGALSGSAAPLAGANAADGSSGITLCGLATGLSPCTDSGTTTSSGNLRPCLGTDPTSGKFVKATTSTLTAGGVTVVPPRFAGAIGGGSYANAFCSRVGWGPPSTVPTIAAFAMALCDFNAMTGSTIATTSPGVTGSLFYPTAPTVAHVTTAGEVPPAKGMTGTPVDTVIRIRGSSLVSNCASVSLNLLGLGYTPPGGLAWLDFSSSNCTLVAPSVGDNDAVNLTGNGPAACRTLIAAASSTHAPLLVPVYDGVKVVGLTTQFHIRGFAALVVTGYYLPLPPATISQKSWLTNLNYCSLVQICVYGYFTKGLIPARAVGTGTEDFGTETVARTG